MTAAVPLEPARFELAPVVDGRAAWERAEQLVIAPLRLTAPVVVYPPPHLVLVTD